MLSDDNTVLRLTVLLEHAVREEEFKESFLDSTVTKRCHLASNFLTRRSNSSNSFLGFAGLVLSTPHSCICLVKISCQGFDRSFQGGDTTDQLLQNVMAGVGSKKLDIFRRNRWVISKLVDLVFCHDVMGLEDAPQYLMAGGRNIIWFERLQGTCSNSLKVCEDAINQLGCQWTMLAFSQIESKSRTRRFHQQIE